MNTMQNSNGKGISEGQRERIEMARKVQERVLGPIMTFSELVRGYEELEHDRHKADFSMAEICRALRLLVIGGYPSHSSPALVAWIFFRWIIRIRWRYDQWLGSMCRGIRT